MWRISPGTGCRAAESRGSGSRPSCRTWPSRYSARATRRPRWTANWGSISRPAPSSRGSSTPAASPNAGAGGHAFLLESVVGGEKIARYSFIATAPALVYEAAGGRAKVTRFTAGPGPAAATPAVREFDTADPLADLQKVLPP